MDTQKILSDRNGIQFIKLDDNQYKVCFDLKHPSFDLTKLINVDLFNLIYTLNPDIYENNHIERISDNEAFVIGVVRHFFEDIGFPQRYSYLHICRLSDEKPSIVRFNAQTIYSMRPDTISSELELVSFDNLISTIEIVSVNHLRIVQDIYVNENVVISPMIEKFIGVILLKICNRIKLFIENAS